MISRGKEEENLLKSTFNYFSLRKKPIVIRDTVEVLGEAINCVGGSLSEAINEYEKKKEEEKDESKKAR